MPDERPLTLTAAPLVVPDAPDPRRVGAGHQQGQIQTIAEYQKTLDGSTRVQLASDLDRIPGLSGALVSGKAAAARVSASFGAGAHSSPPSGRAGR
jgi:hypothetical protein